MDALLTLRKPSGARILDLEMKVRENFTSLFSVSGDRIFEQKASDELMGSRLEFIKSTRVYKEAMGVRFTVDDPPESPIARVTETHGTVDRETVAVRIATAKLRYNRVSLSHTMVAEEIQKHIAQAGLADFTSVSMQAMVLLRCIETLCDDGSSHDEQYIELARGYCGIYLPEHLQSVKPSEVAPDVKTKIAKGLIRLLRDPPCIARWVESGERYLADDLLEKPDFHRRVLEWLEDDTVQAHLSEDERQWHSKVIKSPMSTMFEGIAGGVADRWLKHLAGGIDAYADYYGFLKTFQVRVAR